MATTSRDTTDRTVCGAPETSALRARVIEQLIDDERHEWFEIESGRFCRMGVSVGMGASIVYVQLDEEAEACHVEADLHFEIPPARREIARRYLRRINNNKFVLKGFVMDDDGAVRFVLSSPVRPLEGQDVAIAARRALEVSSMAFNDLVALSLGAEPWELERDVLKPRETVTYTKRLRRPSGRDDSDDDAARGDDASGDIDAAIRSLLSLMESEDEED